jgi:hypothetical protein
LTPEGGWERALARLGNPAKGKGIISPSPKQKTFIEDVGSVYDSSAGKTSSHEQKVEAAEKTKRAIKRMKI